MKSGLVLYKTASRKQERRWGRWKGGEVIVCLQNMELYPPPPCKHGSIVGRKGNPPSDLRSAVVLFFVELSMSHSATVFSHVELTESCSYLSDVEFATVQPFAKLAEFFDIVFSTSLYLAFFKTTLTKYCTTVCLLSIVDSFRKHNISLFHAVHLLTNPSLPHVPTPKYWKMFFFLHTHVRSTVPRGAEAKGKLSTFDASVMAVLYFESTATDTYLRVYRTYSYKS